MVLGIGNPALRIFSDTGWYLFPEYSSLKFQRGDSFRASTIILMALTSLLFKWKENLQLQPKEDDGYCLQKEGSHMRMVANALDFVHQSLKHQVNLSPEQERELADAVQSGDLQARQSLIFSKLKLVASIAHNIARRVRRSDLVEDFIQTGNRVLVECVGEFDPSKARLSTFIYHSVTKAIFRELRKLPKEESVPELPDQIQDSERLKALLSVLEQILSCEEREVLKYHVSNDMTFEEIVERKGKSVSTWKRLYASAKKKLKAYRDFLLKNELLD